MTFILFVLIFLVLALTVVVFFAGTHVSDLTRANASLENQTHAMQKSAETWRRAFFKLRTQALEAGFDLDSGKEYTDARAAAPDAPINCRCVLQPLPVMKHRKTPKRKKRQT